MLTKLSSDLKLSSAEGSIKPLKSPPIEVFKDAEQQMDFLSARDGRNVGAEWRCGDKEKPPSENYHEVQSFVHKLLCLCL